MEKINSLKNYESEYSLEIKNSEIVLEDLYSIGLSEQDLEIEVYLRKIYGDFVLTKVIDDVSDEISDGQKTIEKINEKDINLNRSLSKQYEQIEQDEFNTKLEGVLAKVKNI